MQQHKFLPGKCKILSLIPKKQTNNNNKNWKGKKSKKEKKVVTSNNNNKNHVNAFLLYFLQVLILKFARGTNDFHLGVPTMHINRSVSKGNFFIFI